MSPALAYGIAILILLLLVGYTAYWRGRKAEAKRWVTVAEYHRDHLAEKEEHRIVINDYLHLMWRDTNKRLRK